MIVAGGSMYQTYTGNFIGSDYLHSSYYNSDKYLCNSCNCQILIMFSTNSTKTAPIKKPIYKYQNSTNDDNNGSNEIDIGGIVLIVAFILLMCCCCAPVVYFSYKKCNKSSTVAVTTAKVVVHDSEGIPQYVHIDNPPVMYSTPAVPVYPCDGPTHQQNPNEPVPSLLNPYWIQSQSYSSPAGPQSNNSNNYSIVDQSNSFIVHGQRQPFEYNAQLVQGGPYSEQQPQQPSSYSMV